MYNVLPFFMLGTLFGALGGSAVTSHASAPMIRMVVGVFLILSVLWRRIRASAGHGNEGFYGSAAVAGIVSGVLTMFVSATGPFVATYARTLGLSRHYYVATQATLMATNTYLSFSFLELTASKFCVGYFSLFVCPPLDC